ncbi:DUF385 domain-containing protein [Cryobacterium sp. TMN-39-2]|nr:hypothetical protein C3B60_02460 [Cryobacterium zongtaii]TFC43012.1 DUF385 domain-containing protein [Cryobacterium sp. TMN-39-2]
MPDANPRFGPDQVPVPAGRSIVTGWNTRAYASKPCGTAECMFRHRTSSRSRSHSPRPTSPTQSIPHRRTCPARTHSPDQPRDAQLLLFLPAGRWRPGCQRTTRRRPMALQELYPRSGGFAGGVGATPGHLPRSRPRQYRVGHEADVPLADDTEWRPTLSSTPTRRRGYLPPSRFMRHVVNPVARACGTPTLIVRGRISGREISTPVAPFRFEGDRYVIAGRGETQWVRNLRVAGRCELRIRWRRHPYRATELRGLEHDQVAADYLEKLGRRARPFLAELPDLVDHPIFRLELCEAPVRS